MDDEDFSEDLAALAALEALPGRAMTATERTHKRHHKHGLEAKAEEFSAFAAHSWARATGTKRPDRSCGRWLGLGDWGMGQIFHFAFMRRRVRARMRLRS